MQIGLIGNGRLGKLMAKYLSQDFSLKIYDENKDNSPHTLDEVVKCDALLLAVPISAIESICKTLKNYDLKNKLIIDTCTVKDYPIKQMQENLPSDCEILGTHPMFGPDSASETLYGAKIVLTRVRISDERYNNIKSYLEQHGLTAIEASAIEHDKQIAETLILTHFIGRGLIEFGADHKSIDSKGHRRLMKILLTVQNDAYQLFEDMNKFNPYAKETLSKFLRSLEEVKGKLKC